MRNAIQSNSAIIKQRFERDAKAFNAIYDTKHEFSGWFNRLFRKPVFERYDTTFEAMGDLQDKSILDVGCGSGVYAVQCAIRGAKQVMGVDFSAPMLEIAKERAAAQQVDDICKFSLNDFMLMAIPNQFDFSIVMGVFDYLPEALPFLQKLKIVTKDKVIASFPGHSLIREPLRKMRYLLTSKGKVHFYDKEHVRQLAISAGFSQIEVRSMRTGSGFVLIAS